MDTRGIPPPAALSMLGHRVSAATGTISPSHNISGEPIWQTEGLAWNLGLHTLRTPLPWSCTILHALTTHISRAPTRAHLVQLSASQSGPPDASGSTQTSTWEDPERPTSDAHLCESISQKRQQRTADKKGPRVVG